MSNKKASNRKRSRRLRSTGIVSLSGTNVPEDAKRKIVNIWLAFDGNEARQILEAFKVGFEAGATAQANAEVRDRRPGASDLSATAIGGSLH